MADIDDYAPAGVAVVIGCTGLIGSEISRLLVGAGGRVVGTYFSKKDRASALADELGGALALRALDLGSRDDIQAVFEEIERSEGGIHSVIYAAGIEVPQQYVAKVDPEQWRRAIDMEVHAFFDVIQAAIPPLRRAGEGSLVAITTVAIDRYAPRDVLSAAPKAAVEGLIKAIAKEEGRYGVRANCVQPGLIEGGIGAGIVEDLVRSKAMDQVRTGTPLGRLSVARDSAEAALFLASRRARSITGHVIPVDCGYHV